MFTVGRLVGSCSPATDNDGHARYPTCLFTPVPGPHFARRQAVLAGRIQEHVEDAGVADVQVQRAGGGYYSLASAVKP